jgi:hypothetical protein
MTIDEEDGKAHFNLDDLLLENSQKTSKKKKKLARKNGQDDEKKPVDDFQVALKPSTIYPFGLVDKFSFFFLKIDELE